MPAFLRQARRVRRRSGDEAALELLILTAVRPGELRGARWNEIDDRRALWRIPAERMKMATEHLVPLSPQALAVVERMRPSAASASWCSRRPFYPGKPLSDGTLNSALAAWATRASPLRMDSGRLFSNMRQRGRLESRRHREAARARGARRGRGAYNRAQWLAERVKLMQWWADRLDELRRGADVPSRSRRRSRPAKPSESSLLRLARG